MILKFVQEETGATAVEYGIMLAAIVAVLFAVVILVGSRVNSAFLVLENEWQTNQWQ